MLLFEVPKRNFQKIPFEKSFCEEGFLSWCRFDVIFLKIKYMIKFEHLIFLKE
jgi:hypothetical protein